jgi:hypothetical protein
MYIKQMGSLNHFLRKTISKYKKTTGDTPNVRESLRNIMKTEVS